MAGDESMTLLVAGCMCVVAAVVAVGLLLYLNSRHPKKAEEPPSSADVLPAPEEDDTASNAAPSKPSKTDTSDAVASAA